MLKIKEGSNLHFAFTNSAAEEFFGEGDPITLFIYNNYGDNINEKLLTYNFEAPGEGVTIPGIIEINNLPPSFYYYELYSNYDTGTEQFLKEQVFEIEDVRAHATL